MSSIYMFVQKKAQKEKHNINRLKKKYNKHFGKIGQKKDKN